MTKENQFCEDRHTILWESDVLRLPTKYESRHMLEGAGDRSALHMSLHSKKYYEQTGCNIKLKWSNAIEKLVPGRGLSAHNGCTICSHPVYFYVSIASYHGLLLVTQHFLISAFLSENHIWKYTGTSELRPLSELGPPETVPNDSFRYKINTRYKTPSELRAYSGSPRGVLHCEAPICTEDPLSQTRTQQKMQSEKALTLWNIMFVWRERWLSQWKAL